MIYQFHLKQAKPIHEMILARMIDENNSLMNVLSTTSSHHLIH